MTAQRTARVRIIATATADWTETVEIPDDVLPDEVDGWIADVWGGGRGAATARVVWDSVDIRPGHVTVTGEWTPDPNNPAHAAWAEAQRLAPTAGQTDIFGGEVS